MRFNAGVTRKLAPVFLLLIMSLLAITGGMPERDRREISLNQAVCLSWPEACRWSPKASLVYAISTESTGRSAKGSEGKKGLRSSWNVIFFEEKTEGNLLVAIRKGRIAYTKELLMAFKNPINQSDLRLDSTAAVSLLTSKKKPPPNKVHFELINLQSPVLRVYLDYSPQDSIIAGLDSITGKIISQRYSAIY